MNVLGKIKSKRQKTTGESSQLEERRIQETQKQQKGLQICQLDDAFHSQQSKRMITQPVDEKSKIRPIKPVEGSDYVVNSNVMTKQKEISIRQKQHGLMMTAVSSSNNFLPSFQTNKPLKNSDSRVYFDSNPSSRSSAGLLDFSTNSRPKNKRTDSYKNDQEQNFDFEFMLSNKEKKQVKKSLHLSKGKTQNADEIQKQLKQKNKQVIRFTVKKLTTYGDIFLFEGQIQSLKKGYFQLNTLQTKRVYNRIRVKISCGKDIIVSPETIGQIYFSQLCFLSQNEAMIVQQYILRTVEKRRRVVK